MDEQVMLSVVMTTYNHEKWIATAIESVVMQYTPFTVELVVGEDCSKDRTRAIVEDYASKYPGVIRLVYSDKNIGWRKNYRRTIAAARGRYIAMLDGDDYFTDSNKLFKQVELLEQNPQLGMCYTRSRRVDEFGNATIYPEGDCDTTFEAMLRRNPAENSTVVARRDLVERYYAEIEPENHPEWLTDDLPMWLWFAANSSYAAIDRVMAVHRILRQSVSHSDEYSKKISFCDSLSDISVWYDERYNSCKLRHELLLRKQNTALWVLSYNGTVKEYIGRWLRDIREDKRLLLNIAAYGLFVKKVCWRMWQKKRADDN